MTAVADLQVWADDLEVIRLPHIESEIAVLQINQTDTATLLSQKAQEFNDRLDTHTVQIAAAQDDADTAGADAFTALTRIGQSGLDATTYTDAKIQELRDELAALMNTQIGNLETTLGNDLINRVDDSLPTLQGEISATIAEIEGLRSEMLAIKAGTLEGVDNLTVNVIPDIEARLESADGTAVAARNSFTLLATDYEHMTLVAGFDQMEAAIGDVSATLTNEYYTKATTDSAIAAEMTGLRTEIGDNYTTITDFNSTTNGIKGTHGVKIDNNGHISGYALISELIDGGVVSDFIIEADRFGVSDGATSYTPLAVYTTERIVDGVTVPAGVYAQDLYVTNANIASLKADKIDTRNLTIKDASGNVLLGAGTPLDWGNVGGSGKPENNANRITDTSQITDGAGLGLYAHWAYINGPGKPADDADVTSSNLALGTSGGNTYVNSGEAPNAVRIAGSTPGVYGLYVLHDHVGYGCIYAESDGGFTGQFATNNSGGGFGTGTYCAIDAQNKNNSCHAKLAAGHGLHVLAGGIYNNSGTFPFTAGHDGMIAKGATFDLGDIVVEGAFVVSKLSNSFAEYHLSSTPIQKNAVGVLVEVKSEWFTPASFIDDEATKIAMQNHESTIEKPNADEVLTHDPADYSDTYDYALTNSVGEGAINVCGENGDIEAGDLIVTSSIPGKGMKQSDDIVRSTTVARARQDITFSGPTDVKSVACIYMCG